MMTRTIPWGKFSDKHKNYIKTALNYKQSVAEGAVRSGKTIDHCIIFSMYLETCEDKIHLASGSSLPNAKLNIGDCNGFGLEHIFRGRCRWGKYKSNEALFVQTKTGEKIVIFTGGGKSDSYKSILGNSYGGWIATEINEHYDCDDSRTSFIKVAMARQIASVHPFTLWDLNPSNPNADIYKNYIDKFMGLDWYRYEHFNIFDNATMSQERIEEIQNKYDKNSVWYKRDILGERMVAEGLVFPYFANNCKPYLFKYQSLKEKMKEKGKRFSHLIIGVDFGDNGSKYSWHLTGFTNDWDYMWALDEGDMAKSNAIDATKFCKAFVRFYKRCIECYGYVEWIFPDSASNTLINTLRAYFYAEGLDGSIIAPVKKNELTDRPITVDSLLVTGRLKIEEHCKNLINALSELVWDEKKDIPKDENVNNINDDWDSFCYTFITHSGYIDLRR
jgi:PBSX family phage terminase large subunit|uniref:Large terminase n=1 Tax=Siphoviridae sp. ct0D87 TaxID=2827760 RepID=A0A8S5SB37_9CAUD|nr:MAG TPA: large terminase [Siphoviridae sp. ct0D87]